MFGKESAADFFKKTVEEVEKICCGIESNRRDKRLAIESKRSHDGSRSDDRSSTKRKYGDRDERTTDKRTTCRHRSRDRSKERKYDPKERSSGHHSSSRTERDRPKDRRIVSTDEQRSKNGTHFQDSDVSSGSNSDFLRSGDEMNQSDDCVEMLVDVPQLDYKPLNGQPLLNGQQKTNGQQPNRQAIVRQSNGVKWVSTYLESTAGGQTSDNFIFNSFKTLLNTKKRFIETENLISIIECNLVSSATDIYLHTNHSRYNDERALNKNGLNIKMLLACTSTGLKFKPAFMLSNLSISGPLIKNENTEHVTNLNEWLEPMFKCEMEKNLIYNCVCLTENEHFYKNDELRAKFNQLNCELIVIPNSLSLRLSPYQHSLLLTLNGLLHKNYIDSKQFPLNLDQTMQSFLEAWLKLSESDILNAFQGILNTCLDD